MNQQRTGAFLKQLRKDKGLTQEQLAEHFFVSSRTVSRWETGSNMPDLDMLMDLADFYAVDLCEIIDGERRCENMNEELKETVLKVAEFGNEDKLIIARRMNKLFVAGLVAAIISMILVFTDNDDTFLGGLCQGITFGMMIVGVILTSKYASKIRAFKIRLFHRLKENTSRQPQ